MRLAKPKKQLELKDALRQRYEWLVEYMEIKHALVAKIALKAIYEDKLNVLQKSTGNLDFKIKDLVKAEEEVLEVEVDILQLNAKKTQLLSQLPNFSERLSGVRFSEDALISQQQMMEILSLKALNHTNNLLLAKKQDRVNLIEKETEIERSEIKNPINYAQVKLGGRNNENLTEYISFGLGLNLPEMGSKKLDLNELELDKIEEKGEYDLLKISLEEKQRQLIERISLLITEQKLLENQLENSQAKFTYEQMLKMEESDPIDLLDLKEILLKREQAIQKINLRILEIYVEWLAVSDKMMEQPLRNHLLKSDEILGF